MDLKCEKQENGRGRKVVDLYCGTSKATAERYMREGWNPSGETRDGSGAVKQGLYLSTLPADAYRIAKLKLDGVVLKIEGVPVESLEVDPDRSVFDSVEEEIAGAGSASGKVALRSALPACAFSIYRLCVADAVSVAHGRCQFPEGGRILIATFPGEEVK